MGDLSPKLPDPPPPPKSRCQKIGQIVMVAVAVVVTAVTYGAASGAIGAAAASSASSAAIAGGAGSLAATGAGINGGDIAAGALSGAVSAWSTEWFNRQMVLGEVSKNTRDQVLPYLSQLGSGIAGAIAGVDVTAAGAAGFNQAEYNYKLHAFEPSIIRDLAKASDGKFSEDELRRAYAIAYRRQESWSSKEAVPEGVAAVLGEDQRYHEMVITSEGAIDYIKDNY
ncbi:hypothetical protein N8I74_14510 [Chitiniphilus purpureus]|uniref:Uncharacterized protein n=1 Tax=Chitiniphilus purpureus TaxID=2981137 RepID=A0ABY6DJI4_9NEIS|nr:hypothetical protein [Chitiniphilus sp. CD1]UXY14521.1 hypothetical protein N8I74_14510 [Chitiniphilus sp. CD1]